MLKGVVRDRIIHLREDPGLPTGTTVSARIDPDSRADIADSFGAWKDDPSIASVFEDIARMRKAPVRIESRILEV